MVIAFIVNNFTLSLPSPLEACPSRANPARGEGGGEGAIISPFVERGS
jgi:hypothetical protein